MFLYRFGMSGCFVSQELTDFKHLHTPVLYQLSSLGEAACFCAPVLFYRSLAKARQRLQGRCIGGEFWTA